MNIQDAIADSYVSVNDLDMVKKEVKFLEDTLKDIDINESFHYFYERDAVLNDNTVKDNDDKEALVHITPKYFGNFVEVSGMLND